MAFIAAIDAPSQDREGAGDGSAGPARPTAQPVTELLLGLTLPVGLALGWEILGAFGFKSRLLPVPSEIWSTYVALAETGELWTHVRATLERVGLGFLFGALAGTAIGVLVGSAELARRLLDPTLQGLRAIPSIAWVPLFILWLGIFETSKVALIAVGVFFPIYLAVPPAIRGVDRKLVEVARVYRLTPRELVWRVLLPAALPSYLVALRAGLGLGWMFVVAAEFMGASEGLGYLLIDGQQTGRPATIIGAIVVFAVLGKASDMILTLLSRRLLHWQDSYRVVA